MAAGLGHVYHLLYLAIPSMFRITSHLPYARTKTGTGEKGGTMYMVISSDSSLAADTGFQIKTVYHYVIIGKRCTLKRSGKLPTVMTFVNKTMLAT